MTSEEIRQRLISALQAARKAHEEERVFEIFPDDSVLEAAVSDYEGPGYTELQTALEFLNGWQDSANHGWKFYTVSRAGWILHGEGLQEDLRAGRPISNTTLVEEFEIKPPEPRLFDRLRAWWSGRDPSA